MQKDIKTLHAYSKFFDIFAQLNTVYKKTLK